MIKSFDKQDNAMRQPVIRLIGIGLLSVSAAVWAQQDADQPTARAPQPETLVKEDAGQKVVEKRVEGRLEGVRVKPRIGPEYFIDERAGDGSLTAPGSGEMGTSPNIRTWKIGEW